MRLSHWLLLLPALLSPVACSQTSTKKVPVVEAQPGASTPAPVAETPPQTDLKPPVSPIDTMGLRVPDVVGKLPEDRELRGSSVPPSSPAVAAESKSGTVIARPPQ